MIICHCKGVTDRSIRKAVRDGAISLEEVGRACGAGSSCGGCQNAVSDLIHVEAAQHTSASTSVSQPGSADT
jgi:bacterioferritin-associated ferredoxin